MRLWCKHQWGKVQEDGFQYCEKCGRAVSPTVGDCAHQWKEKESYNVKYDGQTQKKYFILKCEKCGDLKNHTIEV